MLAPPASSCGCRQVPLRGALLHPAAARRPHRRMRVAVHAQQQQQNQVVLGGSCYEDIVQQLATRVISSSEQLPEGKKYIVGIAGAPGSGKSTLAHLLCNCINEKLGGLPGAAGQTAPPCAIVPMDGFHYYKRQLDAMPDPQEAYGRRGAHWTFDAEAFVACVRRIQETGEALVPSFDHGVGDPVEDDLLVDKATRIVIVEGNYLFLDEQPWRRLRPLFNETVFVSCPIDVAMQRVFRRQVAIGLEPEVSKGRIAGNDRPNGELVNATQGVAHILVPSAVPLSDTSGSSSDDGGGAA